MAPSLGKALLVLAMATGLTPVLGVGSAYACSCASGSDKVFAKSADAIFTGTLTGTEKGPSTGSSADPVTYTFAVSRVFKGEVAAAQPVSSVVSGATCGLELDGTGPFLVFASTTRNSTTDGELNAGLCGGTRTVGRGVPAALGPGREILPEPVSALGPTTDDDEDSSSNLGLLALAGGLLITGGAVVLTRKRDHR